MSANKSKTKTPVASKHKGQYNFWRIINIVTLGILAAAIACTYYFIYQNINNTITNTAIITALKPNINWSSLDIGAYEQAQKIILQKKNIIQIPSKLRNIFSYDNSTSSLNSTGTKP